MTWIDASVWLEIGLGQAKAAACASFLEVDEPLFTSDFDVYSVVLTLLKYKKADQVSTFFGMLAGLPKITVVRPTPDVIVDAVHTMKQRRLTFDDCLSYCCMNRLSIKRIATLDQDFRKLGVEYVL